MNCPNCKYPNPQEAAFCGMCYEVLGRSAAKSYLHSVRRERFEREKKVEASSLPLPSINLQPMAERLGRFWQFLDVTAAWKTFSGAARRNRQGVWLGLGTVAAIAAVLLFHSSPMKFHIFGSPLAYDFSGKAPAAYLVGFQTDVKSWSERQGQLDTPMDHTRWDEIGTVNLTGGNGAGGRRTATIEPKEWIVIKKSEGANPQSRTIPLTHSSLAGGAAALDKRGVLLQRAFQPSSLRIGKTMGFLLPSFPPGALRQGKRWTEKVRWVELWGDWKISWTGQLKWTLEGESPCGADTCARLTYQADVQPQIWAAPSWSAGALRRLQYNGSAHGEALFDSRRGRLLSNTLSYSGQLRVPITDVGRIPWELRIGRGIGHAPGTIFLEFKNKIEIRKT